MRGIAWSGGVTFAEALLIAIATHAILVWMLGRVPLPTLVPRSEPERRPALVAIDILEVAQEPVPSTVTGAADAPGAPSASGARMGTIEAARAHTEPVPGPTVAPRRQRGRAQQRATAAAPSAAIETTASDAEPGAAAPHASEDAASAAAPASAEVVEGASMSDGAGDGWASSDGPSSGGTSTGGTTTTATRVPVDPCGSPWTGIWEGRSRDGVSHDTWTEYILTLEQRGEVVTGTMFRRRRVPNEASPCGFDIWHATTLIWGGLEGEELSLRSWPGRVEDYVSECGDLSPDWFARNWDGHDWTVRFELQSTRTGYAAGTCGLGRHRYAGFGMASVEFTRTACAPEVAIPAP